MTIQEHHDALTRGIDDVDRALATVIERGERRRRRHHRVVRGAVAAVVVVVGVGIAVAARPGTPTIVTAGDDPSGPKATSTAPPEAPLGSLGRLRLQAADWKTAVGNDIESMAAGEPYTVSSPTGTVIEQGAVGSHGEAVITQPAGRITVSIDGCDFEQAFGLVSGKTTTAEFDCGGKVLPTQVIPKTEGNPTDADLRTAHNESIECMRAAGLTVNEEHLDIDPSGGIGERRVQISIAGSGMDFDQAGAVQARCEEHYLSLAFARSDFLDAKGD
jgi:hypothetical protein